MTDRHATTAVELTPELRVRADLEKLYEACELERPFERLRYDRGQILEYPITGVVPANTGRLTARVDKFVGGGFAGQVYKVSVIGLHTDAGPIVGIEVGKKYALKILTPPSAFSKVFRNALFFLGYQGAFSAQVNPAAVRVGVLWQKLIRRAMALELGDANAVCDTYATLYDPALHSFGELNEWIDGRIWKFEVDNELFDRWDFEGEPPPDQSSPEYVHKKLFMRRLVRTLHAMGAPELARQYEWWSLKSQPNVLKRSTAADDPRAGLTAVDFRAGLTLLPFLPMSPVDVPLILRGLLRGRWVQFDRSEPDVRRRYIEARRDGFKDLMPALEELEQREAVHRGSLPDVTKHHFRLLTRPALRASVAEGTITAWENLGRIDVEHAAKLRRSRFRVALLGLVSLIPFVGRRLLSLWGHAQKRRHFVRGMTSLRYAWRATRGARIEALVGWHRNGRVGDVRAKALARQPVRFWMHRLCFGWMPASWHRFLTERSYAWDRLRDSIGFAYRFLRLPEFREHWLLEQVRLGEAEGMLTDVEAAKVTEQIKDPYIQKYLRCLAVHVCTVPVTQVVMFVVGAAVTGYFLVYEEFTWAESLAAGMAAGVLIQLSPISPGSITRGLFVLYLMIRERDIRNYYIAAPVAFIHVVGYLAFPMQMVAHNAALARFMAGRWARGLVHVVPVFGESGGLLEHIVFDAFFNLPLSIIRAFKRRPLAWSLRTAVVAALFSLVAFAGYVRVWEWRQPPVRVEGATVSSIVPYYRSGGDLHWSLSGMRVYFAAGGDTPVAPIDYPAKHWDEAVTVDDTVDAVIRRSFFGDEYDGLQISLRPDVSAASPPGASP